jgi:ABC-type glucose/galactose transport system permease subunit
MKWILLAEVEGGELNVMELPLLVKGTIRGSEVGVTVGVSGVVRHTKLAIAKNFCHFFPRSLVPFVCESFFIIFCLLLNKFLCEVTGVSLSQFKKNIIIELFAYLLFYGVNFLGD